MESEQIENQVRKMIIPTKPTIFTNGIHIGINQLGFTLTLDDVQFFEIDGVAHQVIHQNQVFFSPCVMKDLLENVKVACDKYEKNFGEIKPAKRVPKKKESAKKEQPNYFG